MKRRRTDNDIESAAMARPGGGRRTGAAAAPRAVCEPGACDARGPAQPPPRAPRAAGAALPTAATDRARHRLTP
ncbi:hypothetical protein DWU95_44820, partial [Burkholderia contaminans]